MSKGKVNIALVQHACAPDFDANLVLAQQMVRQAAAKGAQIICLQELFRGQYFCQTIDVNKYNWAEPVPGPTTNVMRTLAQELGVVLIVPVFEYAMDGVYFNSAVVFDADGSYLGTYRKTHIPEGPQYVEKYYFTPGDLGYPVFKTKFGTIGVLICWDQWFPEPARILAIKGAEIIFYPSAIGSEPDNPDLDTSQTWIDAVKAHGIHNSLFIASVNRVGREDATDRSGFMTFYGRSFISNCWGEILAEGSRIDNDVIMAGVDLTEIKKVRDILQFHRDRRIDLYGDILNLCIRD